MNKLHMKNIIFDVDSTLVTIEGLDYLAALKQKQAKLAPLTFQAMNGQLSMRSAMEMKMNTIRPSFSDIQKMGKAYLEHIVPGAQDTIRQLQEAGHAVWILTGNFQPAVGMLADYLGISKKYVITNEIEFDEHGEYVAINLDHPLSNNHGKAKIIQGYGKQLQHSIMVGDGATDLDTKFVVEKFIGFGGVVFRPAIAKAAEVYIKKLDLREVLNYIEV